MKLITTKKILASFLVASVFSGCVFAQQSKENQMITNKQKVVELLNSIENGNTKPVGYINPNKYIQHNLAVKDGISGFGELLSQLPKNSAKVDVKRVFEDGDFVFTHTKYNFFGPKIGFDIFRFEEGKIVEHWDNLQEVVEVTASGRGQIDGESNITDLDKTQENKKLVKNFVEDILLGKNLNKITEYISTEKYLQHNPYVKDGLDGLKEAIDYLISQNDMFIYKKVHKILGESNFVLTVSDGSWHGKAHSFYDLFRVENGKIVEHWDTIEEIPSKEKWLNNNGKF
jgi:predicted SnoaL-like aldol condensation-catalyzing enzyme